MSYKTGCASIGIPFLKRFYLERKEISPKGTIFFRLDKIPFLEGMQNQVFRGCFSYITKTGLYSFDSLNPLFIFLLKNIDSGYTLESPRPGGSNKYPQSMF